MYTLNKYNKIKKISVLSILITSILITSKGQFEAHCMKTFDDYQGKSSSYMAKILKLDLACSSATSLVHALSPLPVPVTPKPKAQDGSLKWSIRITKIDFPRGWNPKSNDVLAKY